MINTCYYIKEISAKTGVKAGTIRFYEKIGFLEPAKRMSNQYRVFNEHHIYQIQVCSLVFGGFVNTRLRKISMNIIAAAKDWDLEAYGRATQNYLQAVEQDITRTKKAVSIVTKQIDQDENDERKKCRPNAAILCYAILTSRLNHCRMFLKDHVGNDDAERLKLVSCDEQVSKYTPPTFLYNTFEDSLTNVENVLYYAENLKKHKIPFEMHIFPKGGHGESWCDGTIWAIPTRSRDYNYIRISIEWMRELFGLMEAK